MEIKRRDEGVICEQQGRRRREKYDLVDVAPAARAGGRRTYLRRKSTRNPSSSQGLDPSLVVRPHPAMPRIPAIEQG